jgi:hypothetical protein
VEELYVPFSSLGNGPIEEVGIKQQEEGKTLRRRGNKIDGYMYVKKDKS